MCSIKQINRPLPPSQKTLLRPQLLPPHTQAGRSSSASPSADPATRILLSEESSRPVETRFSIAPPLARDKKNNRRPCASSRKEAALPARPCCNRFLTRNGNCGSLNSVQDCQPPSCHQRSIPSSISNTPPPPQPITFFIYSSAIFIESPITLIINTPEPNTLDGFRRTSDGPAPIGPQPPGSPFVGLIGTTQGHP